MHPDASRRRAFLRHAGLAAAVLAGWPARPALASSYPSKPIRLVVPFPAGQGADTSARALARALEEVIGASVIVDNRPGGNNVIGVKAVTTAPADGYTLFYGTNSPMAANAVFFRNLGYDPIKDFAPVAMLGRSPWVIVVSADSPVRSFAELVALSRRDPNAVSFGTGATGYQLAAILLAKASGLQANIVPYKGTPQALQDVIGQQITSTMSDFGTMRPLIASGRVRPLLVFDERRIATIPEVPCLKDAGLEVPVLFSWTALFAAAGTPAAIVEQLAAATEKALQTEGYKAYVAKANSEIAFAGPAVLAAFQHKEVEAYRLAMRTGHVEPQ